MSDPVSKFSVVGEKDQTFAVLIEPTAGEKTQILFQVDQVKCALLCVGIVIGADITAGFVQHDINMCRKLVDGFSVQANFIFHGNDRRRVCLDFAIDCHITVFNKFC